MWMTINDLDAFRGTPITLSGHLSTPCIPEGSTPYLPPPPGFAHTIYIHTLLSTLPHTRKTLAYPLKKYRVPRMIKNIPSLVINFKWVCCDLKKEIRRGKAMGYNTDISKEYLGRYRRALQRLYGWL